MSLILLAATLAVTAVPQEQDPAVAFGSVEQAAEAVAAESQTGTLIFSRGDCLAIKVFSGGPYTHVAAVVMQDGVATVYDSHNGVGVRKQPLADYLYSQQPDVIHVAHLARPMTDEQGRAFVEHLEGQVGRPYAVKHHLTGGRSKGVHCSEYMTDALMACDLLHANEPSRVSPASLAEGIFGDDVYTAPVTLAIAQESVEPEPGSNRCHQLWIDTKVCTTNCCLKLRRVFLCR